MKTSMVHFKNFLECPLQKHRQRPLRCVYRRKKSKAELRKQRREKLRAEKKQTKEQWSNRDCDTMLTTRQTYRQRQEQRLALFFETSEDAENRSAKRKDSEDHGLLKRKRHSPKPEDLQFDKDGLLQEVKQ